MKEIFPLAESAILPLADTARVPEAAGIVMVYEVLPVLAGMSSIELDEEWLR